MGSDQTLRASSILGCKMSRDRDKPTSLGPSPTAHGEMASPYLQTEQLVFQPVLLPLALLPCTPAKSLAVTPPSSPVLSHLLPSAWGMLLVASKAIPSPSWTSHHPTASPLNQAKGSDCTVSEASSTPQSHLSTTFLFHRAQNKMLLVWNGSSNRW